MLVEVCGYGGDQKGLYLIESGADKNNLSVCVLRFCGLGCKKKTVFEEAVIRLALQA